MRRWESLGWAGGLALLGSYFAHGFAYFIAEPTAQTRAAELSQTGHGYLNDLPLGVGVLLMVVMAAGFSEVRRRVRGEAHTSAPLWVIFCLPLAGFFVQEHAERFLHDGVVPWHLLTERVFIIGLLLQIPFAIVAWVAGRILLRAMERVFELLGADRRTPSRPTPLGAFPRSHVQSFYALETLGRLGDRAPPHAA